MNQQDIIRMAREAGLHRQQHNLASNPVQYRFSYDGYEENLERFAALVADAEAKRIHDEGMVTVGHMREQIAAEREACAKVFEAQGSRHDYLHKNWGDNCASLIRARGETK